MDEIEGFQCMGHSNWTFCSRLSWFCSQMFPTFYFHTGSHFLLLEKGGRRGRMFSLSWFNVQCTRKRIVASFPFAVILFPRNFLLDSSPRQNSKRKAIKECLCCPKENIQELLCYSIVRISFTLLQVSRVHRSPVGWDLRALDLRGWLYKRRAIKFRPPFPKVLGALLIARLSSARQMQNCRFGLV